MVIIPQECYYACYAICMHLIDPTVPFPSCPPSRSPHCLNTVGLTRQLENRHPVLMLHFDPIWIILSYLYVHF